MSFPQRASDLDYHREQARSAPVLSRDEEIALARRWRDTGNRAAAERLVRAHLRMAIALALKYRRYGVPPAELVSEGSVGLILALGRFDPERGVRFSTYAAYWVRWYMLQCVIRSWSIVASSSGPFRTRFFFRLRRERSKLVTLLGEGAEVDAVLAQRMGLGVEEVRAFVERLEARDVSLDWSATQSASPLSATLQVDGDDPEQSCLQNEAQRVLKAAVASALSKLDARERTIVERRLMAGPNEEVTLADLARNMGVSRERARQLESRAKLKLRAALEATDNRAAAELLTTTGSEAIPRDRTKAA